MYCQCLLVKASRQYVAHIPDKLAVQGSTLSIKQADGTWDDGWRVASRGAVSSLEDLTWAHCGQRRHRKASDI